MALSFYLIHGIVLWAVWTFFGLLQVSTNRYLKHKWQVHMLLHRVSGTIVLTTTLIYGLVGYFKLMFVKDDVHAPMGLTVTGLIFFLAISGVVARVKLVKTQQGQNKMHCFKLIHKVGSRFPPNVIHFCFCRYSPISCWSRVRSRSFSESTRTRPTAISTRCCTTSP